MKILNYIWCKLYREDEKIAKKASSLYKLIGLALFLWLFFLLSLGVYFGYELISGDYKYSTPFLCTREYNYTIISPVTEEEIVLPGYDLEIYECTYDECKAQGGCNF